MIQYNLNKKKNIYLKLPIFSFFSALIFLLINYFFNIGRVFGLLEFVSLMTLAFFVVQASEKYGKRSIKGFLFYMLIVFPVSLLFSIKLKTPILMSFAIASYMIFNYWESVYRNNKFLFIQKTVISTLIFSFLLCCGSLFRVNLLSPARDAINEAFRLGVFINSSALEKIVQSEVSFKNLNKDEIMKLSVLRQRVVQQNLDNPEVLSGVNFNEAIADKDLIDVWKLYKSFPIENINIAGVFSIMNKSRVEAANSCEQTAVVLSEKMLPEKFLLTMMRANDKYTKCVGLILGRYAKYGQNYKAAVEKTSQSYDVKIRQYSFTTLRVINNFNSERGLANYSDAKAENTPENCRITASDRVLDLNEAQLNYCARYWAQSVQDKLLIEVSHNGWVESSDIEKFISDFRLTKRQ